MTFSGLSCENDRWVMARSKISSSANSYPIFCSRSSNIKLLILTYVPKRINPTIYDAILAPASWNVYRADIKPVGLISSHFFRGVSDIYLGVLYEGDRLQTGSRDIGQDPWFDDAGAFWG